jgi:small subunit ribosomal protein S15
MARMHSRAKGKSGSTKPTVRENPPWQNHKPAEVEKLIQKLAKEGNAPSRIGLILRDSYGVPDVKALCGKTITKILSEKGMANEIPEDLQALIRRSVTIRNHLENNHMDKTAKRGLLLTESKIGRLVKYYKRTGKLPMTWKWDPRQASKFLE